MIILLCLIKGFSSEKSELSFEAESVIYPTLLELLRGECTTFDEFLSTNDGTLLMYRLKYCSNTENALVQNGVEGNEGNAIHIDYSYEDKVASGNRSRTGVTSQKRNQFGGGIVDSVAVSKATAIVCGDQMTKR